MSQIRSTKSSGTKFCAQCIFWGGQRSVEGSYLLYDTNNSGKCAGKTGFPKRGHNTKAQDTCSKFSRWNVL